jgi:hypothetical protein
MRARSLCTWTQPWLLSCPCGRRSRAPPHQRRRFLHRAQSPVAAHTGEKSLQSLLPTVERNVIYINLNHTYVQPVLLLTGGGTETPAHLTGSDEVVTHTISSCNVRTFCRKGYPISGCGCGRFTWEFFLLAGVSVCLSWLFTLMTWGGRLPLPHSSRGDGGINANICAFAAVPTSAYSFPSFFTRGVFFTAPLLEQPSI